MIANSTQHDIFVFLNATFDATIPDIRSALSGMLPPENIKIWHPATPCNHSDKSNSFRRLASEEIRVAALESVDPDFILTTSLFEGLGDNSITGTRLKNTRIGSAVILYDLIPLLHSEKYLRDDVTRSWYFDKLRDISQCDLLLSISESSRQEALKHLPIPDFRIVNISGAADAKFDLPQQREAAPTAPKDLGLVRPFVMYTGGIDFRKNVEGLIEAFARLPKRLISSHQLAIVCSVNNQDRKRLEKLAVSLGLSPNSVVLSGFVDDKALIELYRSCALFVFPSHHEGFGLPIIEAMKCGAPVVGSRSTSIPEILGCDEALFDPANIDDIAATMARGLLDEDFRDYLVQNSGARAKLFSWDECGSRAIKAIEAVHAAPVARSSKGKTFKRRRLAYVSPIPPAKTGIAFYTQQLLPSLAREYDIDVISRIPDIGSSFLGAVDVKSPEWFLENADRFDRVIYHFGNSHFHSHMFDLLKRVPGVVVLHDFFLSGAQRSREVHGGDTGRWMASLYESHGYPALADFATSSIQSVLDKYPCNYDVITDAIGVIVHSKHAKQLCARWYGDDVAKDWRVSPFVRSPPRRMNRADARRNLGISQDALVVCSFGMIAPTKLNDRLIQAWAQSSSGAKRNAYLVFVGENTGGDYGKDLVKLRSRFADHNISITGWVSEDILNEYMSAADIAVQLRTSSRGESSAALWDCLNFGLPTICNACGSFAEVPESCVSRLPEHFAIDTLSRAIDALAGDSAACERLTKAGRMVAEQFNTPSYCASAYYDNIEAIYSDRRYSDRNLIARIRERTESDVAEQSRVEVARAIAMTFDRRPPSHRLLIDVAFVERSMCPDEARSELKKVVLDSDDNLRIEGVRLDPQTGEFRYARKFMARLIGATEMNIGDDLVEMHSGDTLIACEFYLPETLTRPRLMNQLIDSGRTIVLLDHSVVADNEKFAWLERRACVLMAAELPVFIVAPKGCRSERYICGLSVKSVEQILPCLMMGSPVKASILKSLVEHISRNAPNFRVAV
jgi:glycosyltransferase involved in cell wall biosynthesis